MTNRNRATIVLLTLALGSVSCNKATPSPTAPTTPNAATPPPVGTLFMKGTVFDTAYRPLAGARVEVLDGPQSGLSTTADIRGEFAFTGVFDDATRFRATKEGHVAATRTLGPFCARCNPNRWVNFALDALVPPINVAGDYTMTFVADSACTMLPSDLRSRTFTTTLPPASTLTPATTYFIVRVDGATFFEDWNVIGLGVAGDYMAFWLETLVEQIAPNKFLAFGGLAATSVGTSNLSTITLPFAGSIGYCVTSSEEGGFDECFQGRGAMTQCDAKNHQLILTRR